VKKELLIIGLVLKSKNRQFIIKLHNIFPLKKYLRTGKGCKHDPYLEINLVK